MPDHSHWELGDISTVLFTIKSIDSWNILWSCPFCWYFLYECRESNCLPCWMRTLLWWNAESSCRRGLSYTNKLGTRLMLWLGSRPSATHSFQRVLKVRKQSDTTIRTMQTPKYIKLQQQMSLTETDGFVFFQDYFLMYNAEHFPILSASYMGAWWWSIQSFEPREACDVVVL